MLRSQQSLGIGWDPLGKLPKPETTGSHIVEFDEATAIINATTFRSTSYDIYGKKGDLHDVTKEPLSERLAAAAGNIVYGVGT